MDGSDEDNCCEFLRISSNGLQYTEYSNGNLIVVTCAQDEYACQRSESCIPKTSRCNKHNDCIFREDESDCCELKEFYRIENSLKYA